MNPKSKNLNYDNSLNNNSDIDFQNQRDKIILKIMTKFDLNYNEAENVLLKIEKNNNINNRTEIPNNINVKKINNNPRQNFNTLSKNQIIPKSISNNKNNIISDSFEDSQVNIRMKKDDENINTKNQFDNQKKEVKFEEHDYANDEKSNINNNYQETQHLDSVDSLLEDILPDYNNQISICLDHVDLTFEVQNEKIDTLKESFISFLKRNKSKKIKIHALKDISFKIYKGEKVGIIGYNGAGKSTLLNVITGIFPPDKGTVIKVGNISPLLTLGAGFDYNFSGRKNIILNGAVLGYDKEFLESKVDEIIEFSELGELIDIPIKNYSKGMLAKLGFSIATAVEPDILIIDEILGVGDVNFQKKSKDKIKSLMDGGTTVLLVSHSIPQIRELCDKAIWIDDGNLKEIGEVNKVCDNYLKDAEKASNKQLANIQLVNK